MFSQLLHAPLCKWWSVQCVAEMLMSCWVHRCGLSWNHLKYKVQKCVGLSPDQSKILLLVTQKHKLMLSKRPGSIIQHLENLEQKIYKLLGWQGWSSWDSCSKSCNGGIQERTRRCSAGRICEGRGREGRVCNTFSCQGYTCFDI